MTCTLLKVHSDAEAPLWHPPLLLPLTDTFVCPVHLDEAHWQEWLASAVAPEIIAANVRSLPDGSDYLFCSQNLKRRNDGRVTQAILNRYAHLAQGGWWVNGVDPLQQCELMEWGHFKPNTPRVDEHGKPIKYESPPGDAMRAFFLAVPSQPNYWQRIQQDPTIPLVITEGAKKAGCLLSLGYAAVGLPGISAGARSKDQQGNRCQPYLIKELAIFAQPGRTILIAFDHERNRKTLGNLSREISKLGQLFQSQGCEVHIVVWDTPEKGVDDFVMAHGAEACRAIFEQALPFDVWSVQQLKCLSYPAAFTTQQRYLPDLPIPASARLIGIQSPKGTDKTELLARIVQQAMAQEQRVLLISHRMQLTQALCDRIGILSVYEIRTHRQAGPDRRQASALECQLRGQGLCIDSLHPTSQAQFQAQDWENALVIIDEVEQVLCHLLNSSTCKPQRVSILQSLTLLLAGVLNPDSQGRVLLSDADLSDVSIDFVKRTAGQPDLEPWIATNHWKPEQGWTLFHYPSQPAAETDSPRSAQSCSGKEAWLAALDQRIQTASKAVLVLLDSQKPASPWSTSNLEIRYRTLFPDKKILRIDSETLQNQDHPAFGCIAHLNETLQNFDIIIASPSLETGVSIDLRGHFDSVWGCFQGTLPENSVRQMLSRVREPVERHLYIAPRGLGQVGNGSICPVDLLKQQKALRQANLHRIDATDSEVGCDCFQVARRSWSQFAARNNAGTYAYEATVLRELVAEGHHLVLGSTISSQAARTLRQQVRMTRDASLVAAAQRVQAAAVITDAEAQRLEAQQSQHFEQQQQLIKYHLFQRYGLEITDELYLRDQCGWYPKVLLDYYLGPGRDFLKLRDQLKCQELVHQGLAWEPDVNRTLLSTSVAMLEHLQLPALLQKAEFTNSDPDLQAFQQAAIQQRRTIKLGLNLTIREGEKPDTPIQVFSQFLEKLGRKLVCRRKQGGRGQQERVYTLGTVDEIWHAKAERLARTSHSTLRVPARWEIFAPDDGRAAVFAVWLARDRERAEKVAAARAEAAATKVSPCDTVVTPGNKMIPSSTVDETSCPSRSEHTQQPPTPQPSAREPDGVACSRRVVETVAEAECMISLGSRVWARALGGWRLGTVVKLPDRHRCDWSVQLDDGRDPTDWLSVWDASDIVCLDRTGSECGAETALSVTAPAFGNKA